MADIKVPVVRNILQANDRLAAANRRRFDEAGNLCGKPHEFARGGQDFASGKNYRRAERADGHRGNRR